MGQAKRRRSAQRSTLADQVVIDDVIRHSYTQACAELAAAPDDRLQALISIYAGRNVAFDALARSLAEGVTACRAACSACCHQLVLAEPFEVFAIAELLLSTRPAGDLARIMTTLRGRLSVPIRANDRYGSQFSCPLLSNGQCSVYERRPIACRSVYSASRDDCEAALANNGGTISYLTDTQRLAVAMNLGIGAALLGKGGWTINSVEMGGALLIALEQFDPTLDLWLAGGDPFSAFQPNSADAATNADIVRKVFGRLSLG